MRTMKAKFPKAWFKPAARQKVTTRRGAIARMRTECGVAKARR
jgi:hypothetical protein